MITAISRLANFGPLLKVQWISFRDLTLLKHMTDAHLNLSELENFCMYLLAIPSVDCSTPNFVPSSSVSWSPTSLSLSPQINFANAFIGGGILRRGASQVSTALFTFNSLCKKCAKSCQDVPLGQRFKIRKIQNYCRKLTCLIEALNVGIWLKRRFRTVTLDDSRRGRYVWQTSEFGFVRELAVSHQSLSQLANSVCLLGPTRPFLGCTGWSVWENDNAKICFLIAFPVTM